MSVFLVAVEPSADQLAAGLVRELRAANQDIDIRGIGGEALRNVGVPSQMDISGLAILGFVEGLRHYPKILQKVREAADRVMDSQAEAVILIDSWGFMMRLATQLRKRGYTGQIIKYVAPQVWAMRAGRAKTLAEHVDHLLTIHSFDAPYFEPHGLPVHYVGNAVFDTDYRAGDTRAIRTQYKLGDRPVLAVFFGSRSSEVSRLTQVFTETVLALRADIPDLAIVSPVSDNVAKEVAAAAAADLRMQEIILLPESAKLDVMACATAALSCSGTMTTQLASAGVPTVVAYRLSSLTYVAARRLYRPDYISIVNIAAEAELMPEFLQDEVSATALSAALRPYLTDTKKRTAASDALLLQTTKMRGEQGSASAKAARAILNILA